MKMNKYHCWINNLRLHPAKDTKKKNSNIEIARETGGCKKQIVTIKIYITTGCGGVKTFTKKTICVDL